MRIISRITAQCAVPAHTL